ncbi:MAG: hypothetical protein ACR2QC_01625, partial [Gammaproteobacteria bacterium]
VTATLTVRAAETGTDAQTEDLEIIVEVGQFPITPIAATFTGGGVPANGITAASLAHPVIGFFNESNTLAVVNAQNGTGTGGDFRYTIISPPADSNLSLDNISGELVLRRAVSSSGGINTTNYIAGTVLGATIEINDEDDDDNRTDAFLLTLFVEITAVRFPPVTASHSSTLGGNGDGSIASPYGPVSRSDGDLAAIAPEGGTNTGYTFALINSADFALVTVADGGATLRFANDVLPTSSRDYVARVEITDSDTINESDNIATVTVRFRVVAPAALSAGLAVNSGYDDAGLSVTRVNNTRVRVGYVETRTPDTSAHFAVLTIGGGSTEGVRTLLGSAPPQLVFDEGGGELRLAAGRYSPEVTTDSASLTVRIADAAIGQTLTLTAAVTVVGEALQPLTVSFAESLPGSGTVSTSPLRVVGNFTAAVTVATLEIGGGDGNYVVDADDGDLTFDDTSREIVLSRRTSAHSAGEVFTIQITVEDGHTTGTDGVSLTLYVSVTAISYPPLDLTFASDLAVGGDDGSSTNPFETNRRLADIATFTASGGSDVYSYSVNAPFEIAESGAGNATGVLGFAGDVLPATGRRTANVRVESRDGNDGTIATETRQIFVQVNAAPDLRAELAIVDGYNADADSRRIAVSETADGLRVVMHEALSFPPPASLTVFASLIVNPAAARTGGAVDVVISAAVGEEIVAYDAAATAFYLDTGNGFFTSGEAGAVRAVTLSIDTSFDGDTEIDIYTIAVSVSAIPPIAASFNGENGNNPPSAGNTQTTPLEVDAFLNDDHTLAIINPSGGTGDDADLGDSGYTFTQRTTDALHSGVQALTLVELVDGGAAIVLIDDTEAGTYSGGEEFGLGVVIGDSGTHATRTENLTLSLWVRVDRIITPPVAVSFASTLAVGDGSAGAPYEADRSDGELATFTPSGGTGSGYEFSLAAGGDRNLFALAATAGDDGATLSFANGSLPASGVYEARVRVEDPDAANDSVTVATVRFRVDAPPDLGADFSVNSDYNDIAEHSAALSGGRVRVEYLETETLNTVTAFLIVTVDGGSGEGTVVLDGSLHPGLSVDINGGSVDVHFAANQYALVLTATATLSLIIQDAAIGATTSAAVTVDIIGEALPSLTAGFAEPFAGDGTQGNPLLITGRFGETVIVATLQVGGGDQSQSYQVGATPGGLNVGVSDDGATIAFLPARTAAHSAGGVVSIIFDIEDAHAGGTPNVNLVLYARIVEIEYPEDLDLTFASDLAIGNADGSSANPFETNRRLAEIATFTATGGSGVYVYSTGGDFEITDASDATAVLVFAGRDLPTPAGRRTANVTVETVDGNGDTIETETRQIFVQVNDAPDLGSDLSIVDGYNDDAQDSRIAVSETGDGLRVVMHEALSFPPPASITVFATLIVDPIEARTGGTISVTISAAVGEEIVAYDAAATAFYFDTGNDFFASGEANAVRAVTLSIDTSYDGDSEIDIYTIAFSVSAIPPIAGVFDGASGNTPPSGGNTQANPYGVDAFLEEDHTLAIVIPSGGTGDDAALGGDYVFFSNSADAENAFNGAVRVLTLAVLDDGGLAVVLVDDTEAGGYTAGDEFGIGVIISDDGPHSSRTESTTLSLWVRVDAVITPPVEISFDSTLAVGDGSAGVPYETERSDGELATFTPGGGDGNGYQFSLESGGDRNLFALLTTNNPTAQEGATLSFANDRLPPSGDYEARVRVREPDATNDGTAVVSVRFRVDAPPDLGANFSVNSDYNDIAEHSASLSGGRARVEYLENVELNTVTAFLIATVSGGSGEGTVVLDGSLHPGLRVDINGGSVDVHFAANQYSLALTATATLSLIIQDAAIGATVSAAVTVDIIGLTLSTLTAGFAESLPGSGTASNSPLQVVGDFEAAVTVATLEIGGGDGSYVVDADDGDLTFDDTSREIVLSRRTSAHSAGEVFTIRITVEDGHVGGTPEVPLTLYVSVTAIEYPDLDLTFASDLAVDGNDGSSANPFETDRRLADIATFTAVGGSEEYSYSVNAPFEIAESGAGNAIGVLGFAGDILPTPPGRQTATVRVETAEGNGVLIESAVREIFVQVNAAPNLRSELGIVGGYNANAADARISVSGTADGLQVVMHEALSFPPPATLTVFATLIVDPIEARTGGTIAVSISAVAGEELVAYDSAATAVYFDTSNDFFDANAGEAGAVRAVKLSISTSFDGDSSFDLYTIAFSVSAIPPIAGVFAGEGGNTPPPAGNTQANPYIVDAFLEDDHTLAIVIPSGGTGDDAALGGDYAFFNDNTNDNRFNGLVEVLTLVALDDGGIAVVLVDNTEAGGYTPGDEFGVGVIIGDNGPHSSRTENLTLSLWVRVNQVITPPLGANVVSVAGSDVLGGDGTSGSPFLLAVGGGGGNGVVASVDASGGLGVEYRITLFGGTSGFGGDGDGQIWFSSAPAAGNYSVQLSVTETGKPEEIFLVTVYFEVNPVLDAGADSALSLDEPAAGRDFYRGYILTGGISQDAGVITITASGGGGANSYAFTDGGESGDLQVNAGGVVSFIRAQTAVGNHVLTVDVSSAGQTEAVEVQITAVAALTASVSAAPLETLADGASAYPFAPGGGLGNAITSDIAATIYAEGDADEGAGLTLYTFAHIGVAAPAGLLLETSDYDTARDGEEARVHFNPVQVGQSRQTITVRITGRSGQQFDLALTTFVDAPAPVLVARPNRIYRTQTRYFTGSETERLVLTINNAGSVGTGYEAISCEPSSSDVCGLDTAVDPPSRAGHFSGDFDAWLLRNLKNGFTPQNHRATIEFRAFRRFGTADQLGESRTVTVDVMEATLEGHDNSANRDGVRSDRAYRFQRDGITLTGAARTGVTLGAFNFSATDASLLTIEVGNGLTVRDLDAGAMALQFPESASVVGDIEGATAATILIYGDGETPPDTDGESRARISPAEVFVALNGSVCARTFTFGALLAQALAAPNRITYKHDYENSRHITKDAGADTFEGETLDAGDVFSSVPASENQQLALLAGQPVNFAFRVYETVGNELAVAVEEPEPTCITADVPAGGDNNFFIDADWRQVPGGGDGNNVPKNFAALSYSPPPFYANLGPIEASLTSALAGGGTVAADPLLVTSDFTDGQNVLATILADGGVGVYEFAAVNPASELSVNADGEVFFRLTQTVNAAHSLTVEISSGNDPDAPPIEFAAYVSVSLTPLSGANLNSSLSGTGSAGSPYGVLANNAVINYFAATVSAEGGGGPDAHSFAQVGPSSDLAVSTEGVIFFIADFSGETSGTFVITVRIEGAPGVDAISITANFILQEGVRGVANSDYPGAGTENNPFVVSYTPEQFIAVQETRAIILATVVAADGTPPYTYAESSDDSLSPEVYSTVVTRMEAVNTLRITTTVTIITRTCGSAGAACEEGNDADDLFEDRTVTINGQTIFAERTFSLTATSYVGDDNDGDFDITPRTGADGVEVRRENLFAFFSGVTVFEMFLDDGEGAGNTYPVYFDFRPPKVEAEIVPSATGEDGSAANPLQVPAFAATVGAAVATVRASGALHIGGREVSGNTIPPEEMPVRFFAPGDPDNAHPLRVDADGVVYLRTDFTGGAPRATYTITVRAGYGADYFGASFSVAGGFYVTTTVTVNDEGESETGTIYISDATELRDLLTLHLQIDESDGVCTDPAGFDFVVPLPVALTQNPTDDGARRYYLDLDNITELDRTTGTKLAGTDQFTPHLIHYRTDLRGWYYRARFLDERILRAVPGGARVLEYGGAFGGDPLATLTVFIDDTARNSPDSLYVGRVADGAVECVPPDGNFAYFTDFSGGTTGEAAAVSDFAGDGTSQNPFDIPPGEAVNGARLAEIVPATSGSHAFAFVGVAAALRLSDRNLEFSEDAAAGSYAATVRIARIGGGGGDVLVTVFARVRASLSLSYKTDRVVADGEILAGGDGLNRRTQNGVFTTLATFSASGGEGGGEYVFSHVGEPDLVVEVREEDGEDGAILTWGGGATFAGLHEITAVVAEVIVDGTDGTTLTLASASLTLTVNAGADVPRVAGIYSRFIPDDVDGGDRGAGTEIGLTADNPLRVPRSYLNRYHGIPSNAVGSNVFKLRVYRRFGSNFNVALLNDNAGGGADPFDSDIEQEDSNDERIAAIYRNALISFGDHEFEYEVSQGASVFTVTVFTEFYNPQTLRVSLTSPHPSFSTTDEDGATANVLRLPFADVRSRMAAGEAVALLDVSRGTDSSIISVQFASVDDSGAGLTLEPSGRDANIRFSAPPNRGLYTLEILFDDLARGSPNSDVSGVPRPAPGEIGTGQQFGLTILAAVHYPAMASAESSLPGDGSAANPFVVPAADAIADAALATVIAAHDLDEVAPPSPSCSAAESSADLQVSTDCVVSFRRFLSDSPGIYQIAVDGSGGAETVVYFEVDGADVCAATAFNFVEPAVNNLPVDPSGAVRYRVDPDSTTIVEGGANVVADDGPGGEFGLFYLSEDQPLGSDASAGGLVFAPGWYYNYFTDFPAGESVLTLTAGVRIFEYRGDGGEPTATLTAFFDGNFTAEDRERLYLGIPVAAGERCFGPDSVLYTDEAAFITDGGAAPPPPALLSAEIVSEFHEIGAPVLPHLPIRIPQAQAQNAALATVLFSGGESPYTITRVSEADGGGNFNGAEEFQADRVIVGFANAPAIGAQFAAYRAEDAAGAVLTVSIYLEIVSELPPTVELETYSGAVVSLHFLPNAHTITITGPTFADHRLTITLNPQNRHLGNGPAPRNRYAIVTVTVPRVEAGFSATITFFTNPAANVTVEAAFAAMAAGAPLATLRTGGGTFSIGELFGAGADPDFPPQTDISGGEAVIRFAQSPPPDAEMARAGYRASVGLQISEGANSLTANVHFVVRNIAPRGVRVSSEFHSGDTGFAVFDPIVVPYADAQLTGLERPVIDFRADAELYDASAGGVVAGPSDAGDLRNVDIPVTEDFIRLHFAPTDAGDYFFSYVLDGGGGPVSATVYVRVEENPDTFRISFTSPFHDDPAAGTTRNNRIQIPLNAAEGAPLITLSVAGGAPPYFFQFLYEASPGFCGYGASLADAAVPRGLRNGEVYAPPADDARALVLSWDCNPIFSRNTRNFNAPVTVYDLTFAALNATLYFEIVDLGAARPPLSVTVNSQFPGAGTQTDPLSIEQGVVNGVNVRQSERGDNVALAGLQARDGYGAYEYTAFGGDTAELMIDPVHGVVNFRDAYQGAPRLFSLAVRVESPPAVASAPADVVEMTVWFRIVLNSLAAEFVSEFRTAGGGEGDSAGNRLRVPLATAAASNPFATLRISGGDGTYTLVDADTDISGGGTALSVRLSAGGDNVLISSDGNTPAAAGDYGGQVVVEDGTGTRLSVPVFIEILPSLAANLVSDFRTGDEGDSAGNRLRVPLSTAENGNGFATLQISGGDEAYSLNRESTDLSGGGAELDIQVSGDEIVIRSDSAAAAGVGIYDGVVVVADGTGTELTIPLFIEIFALVQLEAEIVSQFQTGNLGDDANNPLAVPLSVVQSGEVFATLRISGGDGRYNLSPPTNFNATAFTGLGNDPVPNPTAALSIRVVGNEVEIFLSGGENADIPAVGPYNGTVIIQDGLNGVLVVPVFLQFNPALSAVYNIGFVTGFNQSGDSAATRYPIAANLAPGLASLVELEIFGGSGTYSLVETDIVGAREGRAMQVVVSGGNRFRVRSFTNPATRVVPDIYDGAVVISDGAALLTSSVFIEVFDGPSPQAPQGTLDEIVVSEFRTPQTGSEGDGADNRLTVPESSADAIFAPFITVHIVGGLKPYQLLGFDTDVSNAGATLDVALIGNDVRIAASSNRPVGSYSGIYDGVVAVRDAANTLLTVSLFIDIAAAPIPQLTAAFVSEFRSAGGSEGESADNRLPVPVSAAASGDVFLTLQLSGGDLNYSLDALNSGITRAGVRLQVELSGSGDEILISDPAGAAGAGVYDGQVVISDGSGLELTVPVFVEIVEPLSAGFISEFRPAGGSEGDSADDRLTVPEAAIFNPFIVLPLFGGDRNYSLAPDTSIVGETDGVALQVAIVGNNVQIQSDAVNTAGADIYDGLVAVVDGTGTRLTVSLFIEIVPPLELAINGPAGDNAGNRLLVPAATADSFNPFLTLQISDGDGNYSLSPNTGISSGGVSLAIETFGDGSILRVASDSGNPAGAGIYDGRVVVSDGTGETIEVLVFIEILSSLSAEIVSEFRTTGGSEGDSAGDRLPLPLSSVTGGGGFATLRISGGDRNYALASGTGISQTGGAALNIAVSGSEVVISEDVNNPAGTGEYQGVVFIEDGAGTSALSVSLYIEIFPTLAVNFVSEFRTTGTEGDSSADRLRVPIATADTFNSFATLQISGGDGSYSLASDTAIFRELTALSIGLSADGNNVLIASDSNDPAGAGFYEGRAVIVDGAGIRLSVSVFIEIFAPFVAFEAEIVSEFQSTGGSEGESADDRLQVPLTAAAGGDGFATLRIRGGGGNYVLDPFNTEISGDNDGAVLRVEISGNEAVISEDGGDPAGADIYDGRVVIADDNGTFLTVSVFIEILPPLEAEIVSEFRTADGNEGDSADDRLRVPLSTVESGDGFATLRIRGGVGAYSLVDADTEISGEPGTSGAVLDVALSGNDVVISEDGGDPAGAGDFRGVVFIEDETGTRLSVSLYIEILPALASEFISEFRTAGGGEGDTSANRLRVPLAAVEGGGGFATLRISGGDETYSLVDADTEISGEPGTSGAELNVALSGNDVVISEDGGDPAGTGDFRGVVFVEDGTGTRLSVSVFIEILPPLAADLVSDLRTGTEGDSAGNRLQVPLATAQGANGFATVQISDGDGTYSLHPSGDTAISGDSGGVALLVEISGVNAVIRSNPAAAAVADIYDGLVAVVDGTGASLTVSVFIRILPALAAEFVSEFRTGTEGDSSTNRLRVPLATANTFNGFATLRIGGGDGTYTLVEADTDLASSGAGLLAEIFGSEVVIRSVADDPAGAGIYDGQVVVEDGTGTRLSVPVFIEILPVLAANFVSEFRTGTEGDTSGNRLQVPLATAATSNPFATLQISGGDETYTLVDADTEISGGGTALDIQLSGGSNVLISSDGDNPAAAGNYGGDVVIVDGTGTRLTAEVFIEILPLLEADLISDLRTTGGTEGESTGNRLQVPLATAQGVDGFATLRISGGDGNYALGSPGDTEISGDSSDVELLVGISGNEVVIRSDPSEATGADIYDGQVAVVDGTGASLTVSVFIEIVAPPLEQLAANLISDLRTTGGSEGESTGDRLQVPLATADTFNGFATVQISGGDGTYSLHPSNDTEISGTDNGVALLVEISGVNAVIRSNPAAAAVADIYDGLVAVVDGTGASLTVSVFIEIVAPPLEPLSSELVSQFRTGTEGDGAGNRLQIPLATAQSGNGFATLRISNGDGVYSLVDADTEISGTGAGGAELDIQISGNEVVIRSAAGAPAGTDIYDGQVVVEDGAGSRLSIPVFIEILAAVAGGAEFSADTSRAFYISAAEYASAPVALLNSVAVVSLEVVSGSGGRPVSDIRAETISPQPGFSLSGAGALWTVALAAGEAAPFRATVSVYARYDGDTDFAVTALVTVEVMDLQADAAEGVLQGGAYLLTGSVTVTGAVAPELDAQELATMAADSPGAPDAGFYLEDERFQLSSDGVVLLKENEILQDGEFTLTVFADRGESEDDARRAELEITVQERNCFRIYTQDPGHNELTSAGRTAGGHFLEWIAAAGNGLHPRANLSVVYTRENGGFADVWLQRGGEFWFPLATTAPYTTANGQRDAIA